MGIEDCDRESENSSYVTALDDESDDEERCHGDYNGEDSMWMMNSFRLHSLLYLSHRWGRYYHQIEILYYY